MDENGQAIQKQDEQYVRSGKILYGALHLVYYLGLFRMLPILEFQYEVGLGYLVEMMTSVVPMLLLQVMNNLSTEGELTKLQSMAMIGKLLCFSVSALEIGVYVWEVLVIRNLRKLKQQGFEKPSENLRRKKANHFGILATCAIVGFATLMTICLSKIEPRSCSGNLVLEGATCVECSDANCLSCF